MKIKIIDAVETECKIDTIEDKSKFELSHDPSSIMEISLYLQLSKVIREKRK